MAEIIFDSVAMAKVEGRKPRLSAGTIKKLLELSKE